MHFLRTVIFISACLCCSEFVSSITENDAIALIEESGIKAFIARKVAESFLIGLKSRDGKESRAPVLPELPDPLPIDDVEYDLSELNLTFVEGNVSLSGASAVGLSCIVDDLAIRFTVPAQAIYNIKNEYTISVQNGEYSIDALLNSTLITGTGNLEASITGPFANVLVNILVDLINNRVRITSTTIDLGFQALRIRAENFTFDGNVIDWEWLDENAVPLFEWFWDAAKMDIELMAKDILNELVKDCKLTDLIGGDYSCVQLPELPFNSAKLASIDGKYLHLANECNPFASTTLASLTTNGPEPTDSTGTAATDNPVTTPSSAGLFSQISIPELLVLLLAYRCVLL